MLGDNDKKFLELFNAFHQTSFTEQDFLNALFHDDTDFLHGKEWAEKIDQAHIFFAQGYNYCRQQHNEDEIIIQSNHI
jgi:hypothetical protein